MPQPDPPVRDATIVIVKVLGKSTKRTANAIADAIASETRHFPIQSSINNVDVLPISVAAGTGNTPPEQHASIVTLVYENANISKTAATREEIRLRIGGHEFLDWEVVNL